MNIEGGDKARAVIVSLAILTASAPAAIAGDVRGEWARDDGKTKVRFAACGADAVCGSVTCLKDPNGPGKIGEEVSFDMKPNGDNAWAGVAFNPDDGRRYSGKMTLSGDRLTTAGCVLGGLICKSFGGRGQSEPGLTRVFKIGRDGEASKPKGLSGINRFEVWG